jgi:hypothetical protein
MLGKLCLTRVEYLADVRYIDFLWNMYMGARLFDLLFGKSQRLFRAFEQSSSCPGHFLLL